KEVIVVEDKMLVPGDIILVKEGQRIPADARILEANNVQIDEAVLTGESGAMDKTIESLSKDLTLGDRTNMVFQGTYVLSGSIKAVVVATGKNTEIGAIQKTVTEFNTAIPLREE